VLGVSRLLGAREAVRHGEGETGGEEGGCEEAGERRGDEGV
jgi:hypothetical protein